MRELKFRAWDKWSGAMVYPKGILSDGRIVVFSCGSLDAWEGYEIMQYTGLKDKNGKEIYEGDIVKWGHLEGNIENPVRIAIVEFDPDLQFRCINLDKIFNYGRFAHTSNALEVIGNIFEHHHLLEAKGNE